MTNSFAHTNADIEHSGVARVERTAENFGTTFTGKSVGISLALAAVVAAVLAAAASLINSVVGSSHWAVGWAVLWAVLWAVAFIALALLSAPVLGLSGRLRRARATWADERRRSAENGQSWRAALSDSRVMDDLNRAMSDAAVAFYHKHY